MDINNETLNPQNEAFGPGIKALDLDDEAFNPTSEAFGHSLGLNNEDLNPKKKNLGPRIKALDLDNKALKPKNEAFRPRIKALNLDDEVLNPKHEAFRPRIKVLDLDNDVLNPQNEALGPRIKSLDLENKALDPKNELLNPNKEDFLSPGKVLPEVAASHGPPWRGPAWRTSAPSCSLSLEGQRKAAEGENGRRHPFLVLGCVGLPTALWEFRGRGMEEEGWSPLEDISSRSSCHLANGTVGNGGVLQRGGSQRATNLTGSSSGLGSWGASAGGWAVGGPGPERWARS